MQMVQDVVEYLPQGNLGDEPPLRQREVRHDEFLKFLFGYFLGKMLDCGFTQGVTTQHPENTNVP